MTFVIRTFSSGKKVITEVIKHKPFSVIINTDLENSDGLSTIDFIRQDTENNIPFAVIMENDSFDLQKQGG